MAVVTIILVLLGMEVEEGSERRTSVNHVVVAVEEEVVVAVGMEGATIKGEGVVVVVATITPLTGGTSTLGKREGTDDVVETIISIELLKLLINSCIISSIIIIIIIFNLT